MGDWPPPTPLPSGVGQVIIIILPSPAVRTRHSKFIWLDYEEREIKSGELTITIRRNVSPWPEAMARL